MKYNASLINKIYSELKEKQGNSVEQHVCVNTKPAILA